MGVLYARAFTQQALLNAWDQVRDAALADGRPDREVDIFENDAARHVMELSTGWNSASGGLSRRSESKYPNLPVVFAGSPFPR